MTGHRQLLGTAVLGWAAMTALALLINVYDGTAAMVIGFLGGGALGPFFACGLIEWREARGRRRRQPPNTADVQ